MIIDETHYIKLLTRKSELNLLDKILSEKRPEIIEKINTIYDYSKKQSNKHNKLNDREHRLHAIEVFKRLERETL